MQEFKQYGHYMQPRIHKMVQEVWPLNPSLVLSCYAVRMLAGRWESAQRLVWPLAGGTLHG